MKYGGQWLIPTRWKYSLEFFFWKKPEPETDLSMTNDHCVLAKLALFIWEIAVDNHSRIFQLVFDYLISVNLE